jgi:hypothetical protein
MFLFKVNLPSVHFCTLSRTCGCTRCLYSSIARLTSSLIASISAKIQNHTLNMCKYLPNATSSCVSDAYRNSVFRWSVNAVDKSDITAISFCDDDIELNCFNISNNKCALFVAACSSASRRCCDSVRWSS